MRMYCFGINLLFTSVIIFAGMVVHLYAALQMCFTQRFHSCQGDRISFRFAPVHQRVRDRTDEGHVDSEAGAEILDNLYRFHRTTGAYPGLSGL